jgi:hypothetical protein
MKVNVLISLSWSELEFRGSITNGAKIYVKEFKLDLTV